jgi:Tol biopolymer transport system component
VTVDCSASNRSNRYVATVEGASSRLRDPRISANGKQLAVGTDDGKEAIVWVYDLDGASAIRRLTLGGRSRYPVWSPDGRQIAFQSDREGDAALFIQRIDMSGAVERLTKPEQGVAHVPELWSPDGRHLLFSASKDGATFSPDGRWVAYTRAPRGQARSQIYVQTFPPAGTPYQISKEPRRVRTIPSGRATARSSITFRDRLGSQS